MQTCPVVSSALLLGLRIGENRVCCEWRESRRRRFFDFIPYSILAYYIMKYIIILMNKVIYTQSHKLVIKKLREVRIVLGLDQKQVAKKLNKTQSFISKIESGQRRIDIIQLKEFAKVYKKPINYFIK